MGCANDAEEEFVFGSMFGANDVLLVMPVDEASLGPWERKKSHNFNFLISITKNQ